MPQIREALEAVWEDKIRQVSLEGEGAILEGQIGGRVNMKERAE